ncbi:hypothetical protein [Bradyrhizobium jicamae]|uniref:hypothetical protein n=1 Tax=Bradyrhizobium jicamae TaxID=280332 RepID=UPI001BA96D1A|nr:hypothetical protein [Bradyrhizobium jicamae]MBR0936695.1 hypothetical protein [Bradyrhizobium jicamae]
MRLRHYARSNGAPMAHKNLRRYWNFPRARDGAKMRAITPVANGAAAAHARAYPSHVRYAPAALCLRRRSQAHRSDRLKAYRAGERWKDLVIGTSGLIAGNPGYRTLKARRTFECNGSAQPLDYAQSVKINGGRAGEPSHMIPMSALAQCAPARCPAFTMRWLAMARCRPMLMSHRKGFSARSLMTFNTLGSRRARARPGETALERANRPLGFPRKKTQAACRVGSNGPARQIIDINSLSRATAPEILAAAGVENAACRFVSQRVHL